MSIHLFNYQNRFADNTNFGFTSEGGATKSLETSSGKKLPFELYSRSKKYKTSTVGALDLSGKKSSDFALVERQFSLYKGLNFLGGSKVSSLSDVAWLFRALESEAIEHTFMFYHFKDDSYLVQHLSSGGITSAVVDLRLVVGNVHKMNPKSITLVHNHPSGQLISSRQDQLMLERLHQVFKDSKIEVNPGLILNLRSGKYLEFSPSGDGDEVREHKPKEAEEKEIPIYRFDKHLFELNYQPVKISSPLESTAYLSTQKFGLSDKTEALLLNNANEVVGKFVLPQHKQYEKLLELLTKYGATSVILYGNCLTKRKFQQYKEALELVGFFALDGIKLESGNYHSLLNDSKIALKEELKAQYEDKTKNLALAMEIQKEEREKDLPQKKELFERAREKPEEIENKEEKQKLSVKEKSHSFLKPRFF